MMSRASIRRDVALLAASLLVAATQIDTASAAVAADVAGPGAYEENGAELRLDGPWTRTQHSRDFGEGSAYLTREGSASMTFVGTSIDVYTRNTPSAGIARVTIDDVVVGEVDLYAPATRYQQLLWRADALTGGEHRIVVEWTGRANAAVATSAPSIVIDRMVVFDATLAMPSGVTATATGTAVDIAWTAASAPVSEHVIHRRQGDDQWSVLASVASGRTSFVDSTAANGQAYQYAVSARDAYGNESDRSPSATVAVGSAVGVGTYEQTSAAVSLTGQGWVHTQHSRDSAGSSAYTLVAGAASLSFQGPAVQVIGRLTPTSGYATISIDGIEVARVDRYAATTRYQEVLWSSTSLGSGAHTIEVAWSATTNPAVRGTPSLSIDAFIVPSIAPPSAPQGVTASEVADGVVVGWTASAGASGYRVLRGDDLSLVADVGGETTRATDVGLIPGESASYVVVAYDPYGNVSTPSAAVTARYGTPAGVGTHDETSASVALSGRWTTTTHTRDLNGGSAYATATATASLMFEGTAIRWISRRGPQSGIATVRIDGQDVASVDRYASTNQYAVEVWSTAGLSAGVHRIDIVWTSGRNAASGGTSLVLDAFVVPPSTAPPAPASVSVDVQRTGPVVSWTQVAAAQGYRVYRTAEGGSPELIAEIDANLLTYADRGLTPDRRYVYSVSGVDDYGVESARTPAASIQPAPLIDRAIPRLSDCPAASVVVTTSAQLQAALDAGGPGTSIRLRAGTYLARTFTVTASGTPQEPLWICGDPGAIITADTLSRGTGLSITGSNVVVAGIEVRAALKGVMVVGATNVVLADLVVRQIGDEAVHFRNGTTNSVLVASTIVETGLTTPGYGEGVYVGTSSTNWCAYNGCRVDRSDGNYILWNDFASTTSEAIEVKEGVRGTLVLGNTIDGTGISAEGVVSALQVKGNANIVVDNWMVTQTAYAIRVPLTDQQYGLQNVFARNSAQMSSSATSMFVLSSPQQNSVRCDNVVTGIDRLGAACMP